MNKINPTTCVATSNLKIDIPDNQGRNIVENNVSFLITREETLFSTFIQKMTPLDAPLKATTLLGSMMTLLQIIQ